VLSPAGATLADASFDVDGRAVTAGGVTVRFGDGERGEVKTVRRDDDEAAPLSLDAHAHRADHQ
jgi:hypothetical protein